MSSVYIFFSREKTEKVDADRAPETFDIINKSVDITARKNLAHIATVLTQVFSGLDFAEDAPNLIPINNFVQGSIHRMRDWLYEGEI